MKRHFPALIVAVVFGIICVLPEILGRMEFLDKYEPLISAGTEVLFDETASYGSKIGYFQHHLRLPFEGDIYEEANKPSLNYPLPLIIAGMIARLSGSMRMAYFLLHLICPILIFILLYFLGMTLFASGPTSILAALLAITLGLEGKGFFLSLPLWVSRVPTPSPNFIFLLCAIVFFLKAYKSRQARYAILAGVFAGSLYYVYYYYQIAFSVFLLIMLVYAGIKEKEKTTSLVLIFIISQLVAIGWYRQYYLVKKTSSVLLTRYSVSNCLLAQANFKSVLTPNYILRVFLLCLIFGYISKWLRRVFPRGMDKENYLLVLSLVFISIASVYLSNPYLLPFFIIQPNHLYGYLINPIAYFLFAIFIGARLLQKDWRRIVFSVSVTLILGLCLFKQLSFWSAHGWRYQKIPQEAQAEELVKRNVGIEGVIAIKDARLNSVFAARLWRFKFYASWIMLTQVDEYENVLRYLFVQKLYGRMPDEIASNLYQIKGAGFGMDVVGMLYSDHEFFYEEASRRFKALVYKEYPRLDKSFLKGRRLDYLLCMDKNEEAAVIQTALEMKLSLQLKERRGNVSLYKLCK